jgi:ribosome recycling factor
MVTNTLLSAEERMKATVAGLKKELATLRTGRATPALVEHIKVDYAGVPTPLNQLASISVPEARLLVIHPWDKSAITEISKAIQKSELGLNPASDSNVIRIAVPPLSEERRQEMTKLVRKRAEERRVSIRNLRHEAMNRLKDLEKNKEISQDDQKRAETQLQKLTDSYIATVDQVAKDKETELMEV